MSLSLITIAGRAEAMAFHDEIAALFDKARKQAMAIKEEA